MRIILERDKTSMMSPIGFTYEVGLELPPLLKQNIIQLRKYIYSDHPLIRKWLDSDIPNYKPYICLGYGLEEKHKAHITSLLKSVLPMTIRFGRLELISINNSENDHKNIVQHIHSDGFSTCHNLLRNYAEKVKPFIFIDSLNKKCGDSLLSLLKQGVVD